MDSKSIRYKNTRLLVDQVGGVSSFADKIGKGQSQTSQFAGTNPIKGIGNKVAREIELAFDKPHGWLDIPHGQTVTLSNSSCDLANYSNTNQDLKNIINQLIALESKNRLTPKLIAAINAIIATVEEIP